MQIKNEINSSHSTPLSQGKGIRISATEAEKRFFKQCSLLPKQPKFTFFDISDTKLLDRSRDILNEYLTKKPVIHRFFSFVGLEPFEFSANESAVKMILHDLTTHRIRNLEVLNLRLNVIPFKKEDPRLLACIKSVAQLPKSKPSQIAHIDAYKAIAVFLHYFNCFPWKPTKEAIQGSKLPQMFGNFSQELRIAMSYLLHKPVNFHSSLPLSERVTLNCEPSTSSGEKILLGDALSQQFILGIHRCFSRIAWASKVYPLKSDDKENIYEFYDSSVKALKRARLYVSNMYLDEYDGLVDIITSAQLNFKPIIELSQQGSPTVKQHL